MKLLLFIFRWCGGIRLYAHVIAVCSIDASAVSGVVLVLWSGVWDPDACIQSSVCRHQILMELIFH